MVVYSFFIFDRHCAPILPLSLPFDTPANTAQRRMHIHKAMARSTIPKVWPTNVLKLLRAEQCRLQQRRTRQEEWEVEYRGTREVDLWGGL